MQALAPILMDLFKNPVKGTVQEETRVSGGGGSFSKTWANVAGATNIDIVVLPASGQEKLQAERLQTQVTHKIYIEHATYSALNSKQRISFDGRIFNIQYVLNIGEADAMLKAMCLEGAGT